VAAPNLRDADATVTFLIDTGLRLNLQGWVLFPTRDEHVAAFARHRDDLSKVFRVPTPAWDVVKWAWDKWKARRKGRLFLRHQGQSVAGREPGSTEVSFCESIWSRWIERGTRPGNYSG
jgi:hypothetical protein